MADHVVPSYRRISHPTREPLMFCFLTALALLQAPSKPLPGGVRHERVLIPMRDGVRLSAHLFKPEGKGPWPVLLEQRYAPVDGESSMQRYARLASAGFVVAAANFRGAQQSEGTWVGYRALAWGEQKDGYDLVEWLALQPWSTGKIGTFGGSQAGFAQNFLAVTRPPHLVAQHMTDTGLSLFHEGYRIGGCDRPARFKQMDAVCRVPQHNRLLVADWYRHPNYDDYWKAEDCAPHFGEMDVPCFTIGSWFDFMNVGSIESFIGRQHKGGPNSRGRQQIIIGPWVHGGSWANSAKVGDLTYPENARFNVEEHVIRWFNHHLKGITNGTEKDTTVRYYLMGAVGEPGAPGNHYKTSPDWPAPSKAKPYYLQSGGKLAADSPTGANSSTSYKADPFNPASVGENVRAFPGAKDASLFERQPNVLTFTTPVLNQPEEWTGKIIAELKVASDAPDTDFIVRISDVYPDGRSILLVDYIRRARYREGFEKDSFLKTGEITPIKFDVGWISQVFNKGHRIRVTVCSTASPFYEPNPNSAAPLSPDFPKDARVATNTIFHQAGAASRIIAPVMD